MSRKIELRDILLFVVTTLATILLALLVIRWFAPTLLGLPADMVLVKSSREVPPFYENIFNNKAEDSEEFMIKDPVVRVRGRPFIQNLGGIGPNDILGFRNLSVPHEADVITIGDSMTYGNNAYIWQNWPSLLKFYIPDGKVIYSMAAGGWGALQYVYAFAKSLHFKPRLVIVAFYTGNDPIDTYSLARASKLWREFVPEGVNLGDYSLPRAEYPAPKDQQWHVEFPDGTGTVFTPALRNASNQMVKSIDIAYAIMVNVARKIKELADRKQVQVFYTIIPTKEYVYSEKIRQAGMEMDAAYKGLVENEGRRIASFARALQEISPGAYIDVADRLKQEALKAERLYPSDINGHPLPAGYGVIADEVGKKIATVFKTAESAGVYLSKTVNGLVLPVIVRNHRFWIITGDSNGLAQKTGLKELPALEMRELYGLEFGGYVDVQKVIEAQQAHAAP